eukprot:gene3216-13235_t
MPSRKSTDASRLQSLDAVAVGQNYIKRMVQTTEAKKVSTWNEDCRPWLISKPGKQQPIREPARCICALILATLFPPSPSVLHDPRISFPVSETAVPRSTPHHFVEPIKVVSTADAVSAARKNWTGEDTDNFSSKKKTSFRKQVSRTLRSAQSFLAGFRGSKPKLKEEDECGEEDGNSKDEDLNKEDEDSDSDGEWNDSVHLLPDSTRKPISLLLQHLHGGSEVERAVSLGRKSAPVAVGIWDRSPSGRAPPPAGSKFEHGVSITIPPTSQDAYIKSPGKQHHLAQVSWTDSPSGPGGAQGRAFSSSPGSDRSFKILPIGQSPPKFGVERSVTSLSCQSPSCPHTVGGLQTEQSMQSMHSVQAHHRTRSMCATKSSRRSSECSTAEASLIKKSLSNLHLNLQPSSSLGAPQTMGNSATSPWDISNFSRSEAGTETQPMRAVSRGGGKMSCTGFVGGEINNFTGSEAGTDTQPMRAGPRGPRKISCTGLVEGEISNFTGSEANTDTQPRRAGPSGPRKMSCTELLESNHAHVLQPRTASRHQWRNSTTCISSYLTE